MTANHLDDWKQQLQSVKDGVSDGTINEHDAELIETWIRNKRGDGKNQFSKTTSQSYARLLRLACERADEPIHQISNESLRDLLTTFKLGEHPDVKDSGIGTQNYEISIRAFAQYHGEAVELDPDKIEINHTYGRDVKPEDLLTEKDVKTLLKACNENARDRAFIALALATGQRLDALRTLRLGDVEFEGGAMSIELNEQDGHLKGATGHKPLLWAKHYVKPWYNNHPYEGDDSAALFCSLRTSGNRDGKDPQDFLHPSTLTQVVRMRGEKAGLDKPVTSHYFRHAAITRMVQEGLSEQQIKQLVGWHGDSGQFQIYNNLASKLNSDAIRQQLGYPTSGEEVIVGRPPITECMTCGDKLPEGEERCTTCGDAITHRAYLKGGQKDDDTDETPIEEMDATELLKKQQELTQRMRQVEDRIEEIT